jgi:hypothetical protein
VHAVDVTGHGVFQLPSHHVQRNGYDAQAEHALFGTHGTAIATNSFGLNARLHVLRKLDGCDALSATLHSAQVLKHHELTAAS